jgi:hypothetical protein
MAHGVDAGIQSLKGAQHVLDTLRAGFETKNINTKTGACSS